MNTTAIYSQLLEETTRFDFPFLATREKKKQILLEKKSYVENTLNNISPNLFPNPETLEKLWNDSVKHTDSQFMSIPENSRLSGFYLQEITHYYVESIIKYLTVLN